jgi:hypothetical protein
MKNDKLKCTLELRTEFHPAGRYSYFMVMNALTGKRRLSFIAHRSKASVRSIFNFQLLKFSIYLRIFVSDSSESQK